MNINARRSALWAAATAGLSMLAVPGVAWAHGSAKGLGAFWNGSVHALFEPAQLLALLALGLWLSMHRLPRAVEQRALVASIAGFGLAALAAFVSGRGLWLADTGAPDMLLQGLGLLMAVATVADLAITDQRRAAWAWLVPTVGSLTLVGVALSSPAGELRGLDAVGWTGGVALGAALIVAYCAIGARWVVQRFSAGAIVPRVLASWLAASLLLVAVLPLFTAPPGTSSAPAPRSSEARR